MTEVLKAAFTKLPQSVYLCTETQALTSMTQWASIASWLKYLI